MEFEESTTPPDELIDEPAEVEIEETSTDALSEAPEESAAIDDLEEVEHEGKNYKIPKELKSALMKNADYTRKTQEVAEARRQYEAEREEFAADVQAQREDIQGHAQLYAVNDRLSQFEQVNWNDLSVQDPVEAQRLWIQFSQLKVTKNALESQLGQKREHRKLEDQQKAAKRLEEGRSILAREIKGWSPELAGKLVEFAQSEGWTKSELDRITPQQVKSLHRAYVGDQLIKKQQPQPKQEQAKPVPQVVGGVAKVRKSPTEMTDAEFAAWRRRTSTHK